MNRSVKTGFQTLSSLVILCAVFSVGNAFYAWDLRELSPLVWDEGVRTKMMTFVGMGTITGVLIGCIEQIVNVPKQQSLDQTLFLRAKYCLNSGIILTISVWAVAFMILFAKQGDLSMWNPANWEDFHRGIVSFLGLGVFLGGGSTLACALGIKALVVRKSKPEPFL